MRQIARVVWLLALAAGFGALSAAPAAAQAFNHPLRWSRVWWRRTVEQSHREGDVRFFQVRKTDGFTFGRAYGGVMLAF